MGFLNYMMFCHQRFHFHFLTMTGVDVRNDVVEVNNIEYDAAFEDVREKTAFEPFASTMN